MTKEDDLLKKDRTIRNNVGHYETTKGFFKISAVERDGFYDAVTGWKPGIYIQQRVRKKVLNTLDQLLDNGNVDISSAIDVGCGRGDFTIEIAKKYSQLMQVHGCDFVKENLTIAKRLSESMKKIDFHEANILDMPFNDHSFDLTVCINTLHHIHKEDLEKGLSELARITKKYLVIEIKNNNNFLYKYILPNLYKYILQNSLHGMNVYPTSIETTSRILSRYNFRLVNTSGILLFNWLSPMVVISYEKQT